MKGGTGRKENNEDSGYNSFHDAGGYGTDCKLLKPGGNKKYLNSLFNPFNFPVNAGAREQFVHFSLEIN